MCRTPEEVEATVSRYGYSVAEELDELGHVVATGDAEDDDLDNDPLFARANNREYAQQLELEKVYLFLLIMCAVLCCFLPSSASACQA